MNLCLALRKLRELSSSPEEPPVAFHDSETAERFRAATGSRNSHRVSVLWKIQYNDDPRKPALVEEAAFSVIPKERFV